MVEMLLRLDNLDEKLINLTEVISILSQQKFKIFNIKIIHHPNILLAEEIQYFVHQINKFHNKSILVFIDKKRYIIFIYYFVSKV